LVVFPESQSESRTELLLRRANLADALETEEGQQRRRRRFALAVLTSAVIALVVGLTLNSEWLFYAVMVLQVPIFGLGLFLLAGQEVKRLKREVEALDVELEGLGLGPGKSAPAPGEEGPGLL
jgi:undecaprenyl pyrophosphate phosphatase UppP